MTRRYIIYGLVALLVGAGIWTWTVFQSARVPPAGSTLESMAENIGGDFTLVDHHGATVTGADYRGKYLLVAFGYTYCPDVCPTMLQTMTETLDLMGEGAEKIQPLFVSIDPERDTPQVLKDYVGNFHPRLIGLTGSAEQVAAVARSYRVYYGKVVEEGAAADEYMMNHSAAIYLMGPDGKYVTHFLPATPPKAMAEKIGKRVE